MLHRWLTLVLAMTATGVTCAAAQAPPGPERVTLDDAITRAMAASHRLAEVQARGEAAQAAASGRAASRLPTITGQAGYVRTNHVDEFGVFVPGGGLRVLYPDVPDNYRTRLELQWPIYTAGRLGALERAAQAEASAAGHDLAAARADLKLEVTRAYWALVTARETARVLTEAVRRVDAQLADVRSRFDAGFVPPNDVLSVEAERARQQVQQLEAANLAEVAEADLARLIGAADGTHLVPDAVLEPPPDGNPVIGALLLHARESRPDRRALDERAAAAGQRVRAAAAGRRPTVGVLSGIDYARPNPRIFPRADEWRESWDVGVNLSWTLWDGGRTAADTAEASALARAARQRLAEFDATLGVEIRQRSLDLASARAQIEAASQGVRSATEAQRVVGERVAAGVATTTDLLNAQVALLSAELDRTRAIANARLAAARLDRAAGR